ncbi:hypothetical protein O156_gp06 [Mycobacterium phage LittleCherry]|uniref:Uncharacterized protein n=1 Tax=Mycobacterium phage LittleCherry TaxID=1340818 RepID=S5Z3J3_9CAUD|nr:hypothetical protein O156_gp06 [Mycobacterium phage LittleCherry]AGT11971.1 hypothetical protein PBI_LITTLECHERRY_88 [Mycobacterium phage LittleCherry]
MSCHESSTCWPSVVKSRTNPQVGGGFGQLSRFVSAGQADAG